MVCNTRLCRVLGACPASGVLKNITLRKLDPFKSSGKKVGGKYYVGSVRER
jgi:hypothetical protein